MVTTTAAGPPAKASDFGIRKVLRRGYEDTLARVPEALQAEGFVLVPQDAAPDDVSPATP